MVILNCRITKQDSTVLKDCVMSKSNPLYLHYKGFHTGVDLEGVFVHSLYDGTVVHVGSSESGRSVIIQTGSSFCMCYKHLESCNVSVGNSVSQGDQIGQTDAYVHVECLEHKYSAWPVRIGRDTWYKQDVSKYIFGAGICQDSTKFDSLGISELFDYPSGRTEDIHNLSESVNYTLYRNRGD